MAENNQSEWFDSILQRKLLDVWDLAVCEQVSKDLQKKSNTTVLWTEYLERLFRQFDQLVTKIEKYLKPIKQREKDSIQKKREEEIEKKKKKAKHDLSLKNTEYKAEDTALDYLINTMGLFKKFSQKERQIIDNYSRKEYVLLMVLMIDQLQETLEMVMDIYEEKRQMTDNFEIFDQTLRRYLVQITIMFPLTESKKGSEADVKDHPSVVITDLEARKVWESRVGPKAYCCTFDFFYKNVFERDYAKECKNKDLVYYLGYFLNFPKDNIVTTYKWHLFTALFGPYSRFMANFKKYVLGKGFGGLINRLQSEELLKKYPKHIMMRFSRTNPSYMAFSYNVDGYIAHITNNPSWWAKDPFTSIIKKDTTLKKDDAVPIDTFLEELFFEKGFALVPLRIDSSAVKNMLGLKDYASNMNGYLENHAEESDSASEHSEEEPEDGGRYVGYERNGEGSDTEEKPEEPNQANDNVLRGYSTLSSSNLPSSPAKGLYVEALNSAHSSLAASAEVPRNGDLKGYDDNEFNEYTAEPGKNNTNTNVVRTNSNESVHKEPTHRYTTLEDDDDKVGVYRDDQNVGKTAGYDTYADADPKHTNYDTYDGDDKSPEDDLVQADELQRIQQQEALAKQKEQEERERLVKEQAEKEAQEQREREEQERLAKEQADREAQEQREREEQTQREEQERLAKEQADKEAQEQREREEQERLAKEQADKEAQEQDRLAKEQAEREQHEREEQERERLAKEQADREAQEQREREEQTQREEQERLAKEQADKEAQEQREREERDRLAKEQAEREQHERDEKERERLAKEHAEREKAEHGKVEHVAPEKQDHKPATTPRSAALQTLKEKMEEEERRRAALAPKKPKTDETHEVPKPKPTAAPVVSIPSDIVPGSHTYEQLITKPSGVDIKKMEAYLSDEGFESVFKMKRAEFYGLPQWKQIDLKKKAKLF